METRANTVNMYSGYLYIYIYLEFQKHINKFLKLDFYMFS